MRSHHKWFAPAKINLALHVTGQRGDGYHLLDTLVTFANVGDHLNFAPAQNLSLSITGPEARHLPNDQDNIILKAANILRNYAADDTLGAKITLQKNLPVAAGVGGGSTDASATLLGLMDFWKIEVGQHSLQEMALELGADVPMCLHGESALVRGIGEEIEPIALPKLAMVLVNPRVALSTPRIFKALVNKNNPPLDPYKEGQNTIEYLAHQRNDLTPPALELAPDIAECLSTLQQNNSQLARMSGSGATCFGLFETIDHAQQAATNISTQHPNWWVVPTQTIG